MNPTSGGDVWFQSGGQRTPLLNSRFNERLARLSPEGRWLAYVSDELGKDNVYVRPFPGPGRTPVSTDGGTEPVWSPTGRELFYRNGPAMLAVEVAPGSRFNPGPPRRLFEGPYLGGGLLGATYDVSRDGQRFLLTLPAASPTATTELQVIINWFEELRARARRQ